MSEVELAELSPATLHDAAFLLVSYMRPAGWSAQQRYECELALERMLDFESARMILARSAGAWLGFISLHWGFSTTKGLPILRVQDLFTLPAYRRMGVARTLLQHAVQLARQRGASRLQLETDRKNKPARELYVRVGFEAFPSKHVYMLFL
jgi:GNAT superfamily N-acetyltransferase